MHGPVASLPLSPSLIPQVMLRCHATLQGLHESESLLPSESDAAVHHMIAALASSVCRHLLVLGRRDLYPLIADETKALLLATLPGRQREALPAASGGAQSHHHPGTGQDLSMSHVTVSSGGSNLHGSFPKGGKRTRKQTVVPSTEQPAPESLRSAEYRAFEGVVMLGMGGAETEGASNLMGQEDPVLLYPIIVSMPSQVAYREGVCGCGVGGGGLVPLLVCCLVHANLVGHVHWITTLYVVKMYINRDTHIDSECTF